MKFMLHDTVMVADNVCTGGSKILFNFKAPFSATVYEKCIDAGMEFAGFVIPDEFSVDSLFASEEVTDNAITAIKDGKCDVVLCNDVFGKLRRQAPQNDLIYIHPAYGTVSRFGLMPTVSSMDQIGVLCKDIETGKKVLSVISGYDSKDGTSLKDSDRSSSASDKKPSKYSLKHFDVLASVFYTLATAEISNNTNRYDGVKYGYRVDEPNGINDLYVKTRTNGFKKDMKLASVTGCLVLSKDYYEKYYLKAMQIRRVVLEEYSALLDNGGIIELPADNTDCSKFDRLALYAVATLCGFFSVSVPSKDGAVQLICKRGSENALLDYAKEVLG